MQTKNIGSVVSKAAGLGPRQIRVIASTETADRVGDVLLMSGCDLKAYRRNPIVLADHDRCAPIGTAAVEVKAGRLEALISFAPEGASERADEYCALAKAGVISAASVGFAPVEYEPLKGGGLKIKKWELFEISLVAVPANAEATILQRSLSTAGGVFGKTISAKQTDRDRRRRIVTALGLKHAPDTATATDRAADLARLRAKSARMAPIADPATYVSRKSEELRDAELAAHAANFAPAMSPTVRKAAVDRLRR